MIQPTTNSGPRGVRGRRRIAGGSLPDAASAARAGPGRAGGTRGRRRRSRAAAALERAGPGTRRPRAPAVTGPGPAAPPEPGPEPAARRWQHPARPGGGRAPHRTRPHCSDCKAPRTGREGGGGAPRAHLCAGRDPDWSPGAAVRCGAAGPGQPGPVAASRPPLRRPGREGGRSARARVCSPGRPAGPLPRCGLRLGPDPGLGPAPGEKPSWAPPGAPRTRRRGVRGPRLRPVPAPGAGRG